VKETEWTDTALDDMAALDKRIARRVKQAVERFADTGAGNVTRLQSIDPP
jgi:phage-related protein